MFRVTTGDHTKTITVYELLCLALKDAAVPVSNQIHEATIEIQACLDVHYVRTPEGVVIDSYGPKGSL